jgi:hypothetical protein
VFSLTVFSNGEIVKKKKVHLSRNGNYSIEVKHLMKAAGGKYFPFADVIMINAWKKRSF